MPVESAADLASYFDLDEFAVPVTWQSASGSTQLPAIHDAEHLAVTAIAEVAVAAAAPQIVCRAADMPADAEQGDMVTIEGTSYAVRDIRPDGTGVVTVMLEEV